MKTALLALTTLIASNASLAATATPEKTFKSVTFTLVSFEPGNLYDSYWRADDEELETYATLTLKAGKNKQTFRFKVGQPQTLSLAQTHGKTLSLTLWDDDFGPDDRLLNLSFSIPELLESFERLGGTFIRTFEGKKSRAVAKIKIDFQR